MLKAWEAEGFLTLSETGKLVYFFLCSKHKSSTSFIIKNLGLDRTKAENAVRELERLDLVQTEKRSVIVKEMKRTRKKIEADDIFEAFWEAYPRKDDREKAVKAFYKVPVSEKNKIIIAAKAYATQCFVQKTEQKYIYKATNFIKKLIYLSYISNEVRYHNDSALDNILDWGEAVNG